MNVKARVFGVAAILVTGLVTVLTYGDAGMKHFRYKEIHPNCATNAKIHLDNGAVLDSKGTMDMDVLWTSEDDDPVHMQILRAKSFEAYGEDPVLGKISWYIDDSRPSPDAIIRGNEEGQDFPATCDLYFYVVGTASNRPGQQFLSVEPVHMQSKNLKTFSPHVNELYTLVEPVVFTNSEGEVAFTITELNSVLN